MQLSLTTNIADLMAWVMCVWGKSMMQLGVK